MRRLITHFILCGLISVAPLCQADESDKKCACEAAKRQTTEGESSERMGPPWACPLWEVLQMGGGNLYYCERFTTSDCSDPPDVVYAFGVFAYPCFCSDDDPDCCFSARFGEPSRMNKPFPGLRRRVRPSDTYELPIGRAREYGSSNSIAGLEYIECRVDEKTSFFARLFWLAVDREGAASGFRTTSTENIYIAFETTQTEASVALDCEPVDPAYNGKYYVYRASHKLGASQPITILIFRAR